MMRVYCISTCSPFTTCSHSHIQLVSNLLAVYKPDKSIRFVCLFSRDLTQYVWSSHLQSFTVKHIILKINGFNVSLGFMLHRGIGRLHFTKQFSQQEMIFLLRKFSCYSPKKIFSYFKKSFFS